MNTETLVIPDKVMAQLDDMLEHLTDPPADEGGERDMDLMGRSQCTCAGSCKGSCKTSCKGFLMY
jgi:hypothetical protein